MAPSPGSADLERRWPVLHALVLAVATLGAAFTPAGPALLLLAGASSMLVFVVNARQRWTASGGFGAANWVTLLRLLLTFALLGAGVPALWLAAGAASVLLLDVVDGWLARRYGSASEFGADFDVESDALFVLVLCVALHARAIAGGWVLLAGLWRPLFVLAPLLVRPRRQLVPRAVLARAAYVVMVASFVVAFVVPGPFASVLAVIGTCAVSASFLLSFWQRYAVLPSAPGESRD